jgi:NDP-sugar pyrophosphorylase family protein
MKAMVFAAGLGTRLRPLTEDRPKALVELDGRTLLEITLARLRTFGIHHVVVNVHHFADKLIDYLNAHQNFGMQIDISREDVLLNTGGGLKHAAHFFLDDLSSPDEPILVHNVDVISAIDLARMQQAHVSAPTLATLAVQDRKTSRYLIFDEHRYLCGRRIGVDSTAEMVRPSHQAKAFAFAGIHIISPRLLSKLTGEGAFSIIDSYLRLAAKGEPIRAFRADEYYWRDVGRLQDLQQAERDLKGMDRSEVSRP